MSRYFTNADHANLIYFQFPKLLMYGEKYKKMSSDSKLLYMITLDLIKLSMKYGWKDELGRYYIKMSLETIQERMNCKSDKATKLKKELSKMGLLEEKRIGLGKSNRLYILQLEYTDEDIYIANNDHENIENDEDHPPKTKAKSNKSESKAAQPEPKKSESQEPETLGGQENPEKSDSAIRKNRSPESDKSVSIKNNIIKNNSTKNNKNLNLNLDIYEILWNTNLPMNLKNKIKVKIANKQLFLSPEQILDIENAYNYQINKTFVNPNCGNDDITAINDIEFSNTIIKMLEKVTDIKNVKGLIKEWVQLALEYKTNWNTTTEYKQEDVSKGVPFYNWLEDDN